MPAVVGRREQVMVALYALLSAAYPWGSTSRRLKLWDEVPLASRPALFLFEGCPQTYRWGQSVAFPIITMQADVVIYTDCKDPNIIGATQINDICDALDAALAPPTTGRYPDRQTLGGLVDHCRLDGEVRRVPGDLDGDGLVWCSVLITLPL